MSQQHPTNTSRIYQLIKVIEFDIDLDVDSFTLRIELLQSTTAPD